MTNGNIYIKSKNTCKFFKDFIDISIIEITDTDLIEILCDQGTFQEQFKIPISELEMSQYRFHYTAWVNFVKSENEICLIVENIIEYVGSYENLLEMFDNSSPQWDVFIPYDAVIRPDVLDDTYFNGIKLDISAYFLTKKGVIKLLECSNPMIYPVDNLLMTLIDKEELDVVYEEHKSLFLTDSYHKYLEDINYRKLNYILSINLWENHEKEEALKIIKYLFKLKEELNLDLFLSDGSLLGCIRHGGFMGWDDDIDISIDVEDLPSLLNKIRNDGIYEVSQHFWCGEIECYKIWNRNFPLIPGYNYSFPFVDLWLYKTNGNDLDFIYKTEQIKVVFPLKPMMFVNEKVYIPNDTLTYLDHQYKNWRSRIEVYRWCHKTEQNNLFPITADINTNNNGRLLQAN
ncbi:LicD family protein [Sphingobacterium sp. GVS05A]|uniref:LicD family protein n=1 Tax=Sphingobacterium sp. GVS05A TaxID=2862679 RepID=UPI001CC01D86|nr:LicD family protein [Sphingobacterium sp. GVS05A]